ncbi:MAG: hypothetical protein AB7K35_17710 [Pseudorhodoplanes sp.]
MNWKTDLKLADLDPATAIEVTCTRCGLARYEASAQLMNRRAFRNFYLDEVERTLRCAARACGDRVRIALIHDDKNEAFVGGMA